MLIGEIEEYDSAAGFGVTDGAASWIVGARILVEEIVVTGPEGVGDGD